jgi:DNA-binding transcriptional LysR family regulator
MELRQLRYFVTVADELNFRRAAERLTIAQPALSRQIQALEREVGVALFTRTSRRVELTNAGERVLEQARLTLRQAERTATVARLSSRGELGRLALGYIRQAPFSVVSQLIRRFRDQRPNVELALTELSTPDQLRALREGTLDAGISRGHAGADGISELRVDSEPIYVAVSSGHRLASQASVAVGQLRDEPFIALARSLGEVTYDNLIAMCVEAGFSPQIIQETSDVRILLGLVAARLGICITSGAARDLRISGVRFIPVRPARRIDFFLSWRSAAPSPILRFLIEVARTVRQAS